MNLNKEQQKAVEFGDGPVLIVAGAGTGKTTVITRRIAHLIKQGKAKPDQILAVTFTDKAAGEMEERVDRLLDIGYTDLWVSTFHAFCQRILEQEGLDIGLSTDFKTITQTGAWMLVRQNLDKFNLNYYKPLGNPAKFLHILLKHFDKCKDQGIYPKEYLIYADQLKTNLTDLPEDKEEERIKEVANAYHIYQKLLLDNNLLDFSDVINYCLKLFQKRPHILEKYRKQFKYILVDEFQDVNFAQYQLIKLLASPKNNLTVCADNFQAIYKFRGASFVNILRFNKDYPRAEKIALINNYRSCQNILDLAYDFISQNQNDQMSDIDKKLIAPSSKQGIIEHLHFKDIGDEAQGVANKIIEIIKSEKDVLFSDFAILVRANESANIFCRALERAGIPYQFLASKGLYSKPIILDIISYFKLLDNYHESLATHRILNLPFLEISSESIMQVIRYAQKKGKSMFEALNQVALIAGIDQRSAKGISLVLSLIRKHSQMAKDKNVSEVLFSFVKDSGYLKYLLKKDDQNALSDLNQFYKKVKEFEQNALDPILKNFMEQMNLELESGEQGSLEFDIEQGPDLVKVMTIHGAKGLEFQNVFIVSMVDRRFPTSERKQGIEIPETLNKEKIPEGDVHLEEERRLCYVAITRAKEKLFFTSASDYGGQRKKKLSRFLTEMGFIEKEISVPKEKRIDIKQKKELTFILPNHFSFSQLSSFSKCPLSYKYSHILKLPTSGKAVFSFGQTMHSTLFEFVKMASGAGVAQKDLFSQKSQRQEVTLAEFNEILQKKWIDEWYENDAQQAEYLKLGKKIVKSFYTQFKSQQPEILKINNELALELSFKLRIGQYNIKGRIDRIDKIQGGVKIVDYKTGKAKEKLSADNKEQLLIYQIALEEVFNLNPVELVYYYLESGTQVSFLGSDKDKDKQKQNILAKIEEIKKSDFAPCPGFHCGFCDFKNICEYAKK